MLYFDITPRKISISEEGRGCILDDGSQVHSEQTSCGMSRCVTLLGSCRGFQEPPSPSWVMLWLRIHSTDSGGTSGGFQNACYPTSAPPPPSAPNKPPRRLVPKTLVKEGGIDSGSCLPGSNTAFKRTEVRLDLEKRFGRGRKAFRSTTPSEKVDLGLPLSRRALSPPLVSEAGPERLSRALLTSREWATDKLQSSWTRGAAS